MGALRSPHELDASITAGENMGLLYGRPGFRSFTAESLTKGSGRALQSYPIDVMNWCSFAEYTNATTIMGNLTNGDTLAPLLFCFPPTPIAVSYQINVHLKYQALMETNGLLRDYMRLPTQQETHDDGVMYDAIRALDNAAGHVAPFLEGLGEHALNAVL